MGDRIVRVEALVEQLVKTVGPHSGIPTPSSSSSDGGRVLSLVLNEPVSVCFLPRDRFPLGAHSLTG